jgi:cytochrome b6
MTRDRASRWIAERLGSDALRASLGARRVSSHRPSHYLGGVVFFLFLLEVLSGILLLLPYRPDPAAAHSSLVSIVGRVPYGSLIRGVHAWSSHLFVAALLAHLATTLLLRRFRSPRELVWLTGLMLFVVGLGMAFTGAILPWSQDAYSQAGVSSEMAGKVPLIGPGLRYFLRGGEEVNAWTLHHAFGFHSGVLPALTTFILAMHVFLEQRHPASRAPTDTGTIPVYPDFLVRLALLWTAVLILVISLATFAPQPIGAPADATVAASGALPPWYFLFLHQLLKSAPPRLLGVDSASFIIGGVSLLFLFAVALPFIDRRGSRLTVGIGLALLSLWVLLTANALV